jgi:hypothetical protein
MGRHLRRVIERYTGHCRSSGTSNVFATTVQILLRTKYFTDSLGEGSSTIFKLFLKLYEDLATGKSCLDINPLINLDPLVLGDKSELTDCLSGLFRLFGSSPNRLTSPPGVVFQIPHGSSITQYFSGCNRDAISDLGVIFFDTRSLVLRDIPETLPGFSLYVVVNRLSKTKPHLSFRDSKGWLSIQGRDIEDASSFRRDNISVLGYICDLKCTHCFRHPLTCNRRAGKQPETFPAVSGPPRAVSARVFASRLESPSTLDFMSLKGLQTHQSQITVVFWPDPEKSAWGTEPRETVLIGRDATGDQLLSAVRELFDPITDPSASYEIIKVFLDLERIEMIQRTDPITANDGDVFHIQPAIPPAQACPVFLMIGMSGYEPQIDFRRIPISSGQLNLSTATPPNSFRSILAKLVGGIDRVNRIDVVMEKNGVQILESDGIFLLDPPVAEGAKRLLHVRIALQSGF